MHFSEVNNQFQTLLQTREAFDINLNPEPNAF